MSNKVSNSQDRTLVIGDQTVILRFSVRALLALKDLWQVETDAEIESRLNGVEGEGAQVNDLVDFLWAASLTHQRTMSRDDMIDMLDEAGGEKIAEGVQLLLKGAAVPNGDGEADNGATR